MRSRNRRSWVARSAVRGTYVSGVDTLSPQTRTYNLNSISIKNAALTNLEKVYQCVYWWDMNHCTHTSQTCHPHYEPFQTRPFSYAMQQRFSWTTSCKYSQPHPQKVRWLPLPPVATTNSTAVRHDTWHSTVAFTRSCSRTTTAAACSWSGCSAANND